MTAAGRPQKADPGSLYAMAHQFYWDSRRLSEGRPRWRINTKLQNELEAEAEKADLRLSDEEKRRHEGMVEVEIQSGRLNEAQREDRLREMEESQLWVTREWLRRCAAEEAREEFRFPGERELIDTLLNPETTPDQIRELCRNAVMTRTIQVEPGVTKEIEVPAWPIFPGSTFPTYLSQYAEQYAAALRDPRFPRCDARPSTRLKQFWFLSRALAGALFGVTCRTAINLVGSLRPEELFQESRDAKPQRKRLRRKYKSRLPS
jgi:hypothetical protein